MKRFKINSSSLVSIALGVTLLATGLANAQDWTIEIVDPSVNVGYYSSIALDSQGLKHVSYYDAYNQNLKYAHWTGNDWDVSTVDSSPSYGHVGQYTSIALDSNDYPHISYYVGGSGGVLRYARWDGSAWQIATVEAGYEKIYTSIAIDSAGHAHISFCDEGPGDLKYAYWNGSNWEITIVEDGFCSGYCTSIALDSSEYPHISYIDGSNGYLRYAYWDGSAWHIASPDSPGFYGFEGIMTSLALDSADNPHIAYTHWELDDLRYAYYDGSVWDISTVDNAGITGKYPSIALDSSGFAHISYRCGGTGLLYSRWTGSDWERTEVDTDGNSGLWTAIALDQMDSPHISYAAGSSAILKCTWYLNTMSVDDCHDNRRGSRDQLVYTPPPSVLSPANGAPNISFTLPHSCNVRIELFTPDGRKAATMANGEYPAGTHEIEVGNHATGVYLCRLEAGSFSTVNKMIVVQ